MQEVSVDSVQHDGDRQDQEAEHTVHNHRGLLKLYLVLRHYLRWLGISIIFVILNLLICLILSKHPTSLI